MARPRKADKDKQTNMFCIRLTPDERLSFEEAADQRGLGLSDYFRHLLTGRTPTVKSERRVNAEAVTALLRLGVNLNQIARRMNMATDTPADLDALSALIGDIRMHMERLEGS